MTVIEKNSNPVIGRVNKIHIDNTFIYSTYQYNTIQQQKNFWHEIELHVYAHNKFRGKEEHDIIEIIVKDYCGWNCTPVMRRLT